MCKLKSFLYFSIFLILPTYVCANDVTLDLIYYNEKVQIVTNEYSYGQAQIDVDSVEYHLPAFRKGEMVYVLVPADKNALVPDFSIDFLGYTNTHILLGANELTPNRGSWIIQLSMANDNLSLVDYVKHSNLNNDSYDFYHSLPPISSAQRIGSLDRDNKPEIMIDFYERGFRMLLEVSNSGLNVDYNSTYYKQYYNDVIKVSDQDSYQYREFLLYGTLIGAFSIQRAVNVYNEKNASNDINIPNLVELTTKLKDMSNSNNLTRQVVDYMRGDIQENELLIDVQKTSVDSIMFMETVKYFDDSLKKAAINEDVFAEFMSYLFGGIEEKDFTAYAKKFLASDRDDLTMILKSPSIINEIIHEEPQLTIMMFDTSIEELEKKQ